MLLQSIIYKCGIHILVDSRSRAGSTSLEQRPRLSCRKALVSKAAGGWVKPAQPLPLWSQGLPQPSMSLYLGILIAAQCGPQTLCCKWAGPSPLTGLPLGCTMYQTLMSIPAFQDAPQAPHPFLPIWVTTQEADDNASQNLLCPRSGQPGIETLPHPPPPTGLQRATAQEQVASLLSSAPWQGSASTTARLAKALNMVSRQNSAHKAADRCREHVYRDRWIKVSQFPARLIPRPTSTSHPTRSPARLAWLRLWALGVPGAKAAGVALCRPSPVALLPPGSHTHGFVGGVWAGV